MAVVELRPFQGREARNTRLRDRFDDLMAELAVVPMGDRLALTTAFQNQLQALDADTLAGQARTGAGDRELCHLAGRGRTRSRREAVVMARRARAVANNPDLSADLASGELTAAGLDAIAMATEAGFTRQIDRLQAHTRPAFCD